MTKVTQQKEMRLQKLNPNAWIRYLIRYKSTKIYRILNSHTNKIINTRDVIFNEDEFFSGDIDSMKDDMLHITTEEIQALLQSVQTTNGSSEPSATSQEEDDELSELVGETIVVRGGYIDSVDQSAVDEMGKLDHLRPSTICEPLLTPGSTPQAYTTLAATAISGLTDNEAVSYIHLTIPARDSRVLSRHYGV